jgi:hypothetical protein
MATMYVSIPSVGHCMAANTNLNEKLPEIIWKGGSLEQVVSAKPAFQAHTP